MSWSHQVGGDHITVDVEVGGDHTMVDVEVGGDHIMVDVEVGGDHTVVDVEVGGDHTVVDVEVGRDHIDLLTLSARLKWAIAGKELMVGREPNQHMIFLTFPTPLSCEAYHNCWTLYSLLALCQFVL